MKGYRKKGPVMKITYASLEGLLIPKPMLGPLRLATEAACCLASHDIFSKTKQLNSSLWGRIGLGYRAACKRAHL